MQKNAPKKQLSENREKQKGIRLGFFAQNPQSPTILSIIIYSIMWFISFIMFFQLFKGAVTHCNFNNLITPQQATLCDMDVINRGTTQSLLPVDGMMKTQTDFQPTPYECRNKTSRMSFSVGWLSDIGPCSGHAVGWSPHILWHCQNFNRRLSLVARRWWQPPLNLYHGAM